MSPEAPRTTALIVLSLIAMPLAQAAAMPYGSDTTVVPVPALPGAPERTADPLAVPSAVVREASGTGTTASNAALAEAGLELARQVHAGASWETVLEGPFAELVQLQQERVPAPREGWVPLPGLPATPSFASLPTALGALLAQHQVEPTREQAWQLAQLAQLPLAQQTALTEIVEAHLFQAQAATLAIEHLAATGQPVPPTWWHAMEKRVLEDVLAAVSAFEGQTSDATCPHASCMLHTEAPGQVSCGSCLASAEAVEAANLGPVIVCGVLAFDPAPDRSVHYACDVPLSIDLGGDDTYTNNAGGASGDDRAPSRTVAALLIELGGNDVYDTARDHGAVIGAGSAGSGMLLDLAGDDHYQGGFSLGAAIGAGLLGTGLLLDLAGSDMYVGLAGTWGPVAGAGAHGSGTLVDAGGANTFDVRTAAAAGAAGLGAASAHTLTVPLLPRPCTLAPDPPVGLCERFPGRPGVQAASGLLIAGPGDDTFTGRGSSLGDGTGGGAGATQAAALGYAVGALVDLGGRNSYHAHEITLAQGTGALGGVGVLVDGPLPNPADGPAGPETHDTYTLGNPGGNSQPDVTGQGAGIMGVGLLIRADKVGQGTYRAEIGSSPHAVYGAGIGILYDLGSAVRQGQPSIAICAPDEAYAAKPYDGASGTQATLCLGDRNTQQPIRSPVTDGNVPNLPKPTIPCDGACETVVDTVFKPGASDWFGRSQITSTLSGGVQLEGSSGYYVSGDGEEICGNLKDDDGDGLVDLNDGECNVMASNSGVEQVVVDEGCQLDCSLPAIP